MVGRLNVSKNQYTKSITIPPVGNPNASPPTTEVAKTPTTSQPTQTTNKTPNKLNTTPVESEKDSTNKSTVTPTQDESSIIKNKVEVDFPSVSFDNVGFEVSPDTLGSESIVLPEPSSINTREYAPVSGVKQRTVNEVNTESTPSSATSSNQGVSSGSSDGHEHGLLRELSSNSGVNIIVRGDNASITVSSTGTGVSASQENALPTMQDIKNANTLEDLTRIEERYTETIKYLEAKKHVLSIESKLN